MGRFVQDMLSEEVFWISGKLPLRYVSSCMSRIFLFLLLIFVEWLSMLY